MDATDPRWKRVMRAARMTQRRASSFVGGVARAEELAQTWGGGLPPGTMSKVGEKSIAGEACDLLSSSASAFGTAIDLCVWRGIRAFLTPLGPKEIFLFSETRAPPSTTPMTVTEPIALNTAGILHWVEQATEIFTPPQPTK